MLKIFKCFQCNSVFDRPSQLDYHYRSKHLGEKSHVCQICEKGFFRKADLRMHLNIHLGTNFYICEVCGRKFNHISNLIRHCRIHTGSKPYVCPICDKRFTQISSLAKHKQIHTPKDCRQRYCNPSLINNNSQITAHILNENKTINDDIKNKNHEILYIEQKCINQNIARVSDIQQNEIVSNKHNTDVGNKAFNNKQDYFIEIEERLKCINLSTNKTVVSNSPQDITYNELMQSKDIACQFSKNNFTFLSQDKESNAESDIHNDENILRLNVSDTYAIQEICKETSTNNVKYSSNVETNLQICNFSEALANKKFLLKQICKEIINENRKGNKLLNDDNQLYLKPSDSGMLKLNESRYCHNTDLANVNVNHTMKSQHSENIAPNDTLYTPGAKEDQNNLLQHSEEILNNSSNAMLNNEEPMLRLVQTETGEQFYEYVINNLVEKIQNVSCEKDLENATEETANAFEDCQKINSNLKESNKKSDHIEQQCLEALTINNEFNYAQLESHGGEKNFSVLCHGENSQQNLQAYNFEILELLESHTDFDNVETGFEALEKLNYENCERFLELEVADIGVEFSTHKEPSMVRLIQNDGEQLLELLQDSQIIEQENQNFLQTTNNLNRDCSNVLQDSNKITDCSKSKSDFFAYVDNNIPLEENINNNQAMENNELNVNQDVNNSTQHLHIDKITNKGANSDTRIGISKEPKKIALKKFHCSVCNKTFSTAYNYKQHIGIHFADQQKFHCKDCGMSFAWKSTLNKHIMNNHSLDGPQKFVCDICPKVYSTLSQVNEHVKRDHLKVRDHVCLTCGKTFFKRFDLKIHNRIHTDERPYVCGVCSKKFHHQSHFIRHKRIHLDIRPYLCTDCPKRFAQVSSLKAHQRKHEQIRTDFTNYQIQDEDDPIALPTL